ncbi:MAG TPA: TIGR03621 family F420-dependent LLM class oxidoreductase [Methylomirabilota bacterium]|nr:TIGR03621 family F420-dependent LLM class oxidoreductase [Methylomirabilota bacterium]
MTRPFRFIVSMPRLADGVDAWQSALRRIEDFGYSTIAISDHFTQGWAMEPLVTLAAAAAETERVRLLTLVLGNDYRHPVLVHKAAATIDVISGGRLELGLGAGWLRAEYEAAGLAYDGPKTRRERLEESVAVIKGLFGPDPLDFTGTHYRIAALDGLPKPVQKPHPPIAIGGGGPRMLELAGRVADIAGVYATLARGSHDVHQVVDMSPDSVAAKVEWVRTGARAAGRDPADVELELSLLRCRVVASARETQEVLDRTATAWRVSPTTVAASPAVLVGQLDQCVDRLLECRERYGVSYIHVGTDIENAAPVVARLAGR